MADPDPQKTPRGAPLDVERVARTPARTRQSAIESPGRAESPSAKATVIAVAPSSRSSEARLARRELDLPPVFDARLADDPPPLILQLLRPGARPASRRLGTAPARTDRVTDVQGLTDSLVPEEVGDDPAGHGAASDATTPVPGRQEQPGSLSEFADQRDTIRGPRSQPGITVNGAEAPQGRNEANSSLRDLPKPIAVDRPIETRVLTAIAHEDLPARQWLHHRADFGDLWRRPEAGRTCLGESVPEARF